MSDNPLKRKAFVEFPDSESKLYKIVDCPDKLWGVVFENNFTDLKYPKSLPILLDGKICSVALHEIFQDSESLEFYYSKLIRYPFCTLVPQNELDVIQRTESRMMQIVQERFGMEVVKSMKEFKNIIDLSYRNYAVICNGFWATWTHEQLFSNFKRVQASIRGLEDFIKRNNQSHYLTNVAAINLERIKKALEDLQNEPDLCDIEDNLSSLQLYQRESYFIVKNGAWYTCYEGEVFKSEETLKGCITELFKHLERKSQDQDRTSKALNHILERVRKVDDSTYQTRIYNFFNSFIPN